MKKLKQKNYYIEFYYIDLYSENGDIKFERIIISAFTDLKPKDLFFNHFCKMTGKRGKFGNPSIAKIIKCSKPKEKESYNRKYESTYKDNFWEQKIKIKSKKYSHNNDYYLVY